MRSNTDGDKEIKHQKSVDYRSQQKNNLKSLRSELLKLKQTESLDIKKVSKEYSERLKQFKVSYVEDKRQKVKRIQASLENSRKKINYYWDQKKRYYTEQHNKETIENEKMKEILEKELERYEKIESELLNRLEKTQDVQTRLYDKFEEAFMTSAHEIGEREKTQKEQLALQNNKKKQEKSNMEKMKKEINYGIEANN